MFLYRFLNHTVTYIILSHPVWDNPAIYFHNNRVFSPTICNLFCIYVYDCSSTLSYYLFAFQYIYCMHQIHQGKFPQVKTYFDNKYDSVSDSDSGHKSVPYTETEQNTASLMLFMYS